MLEHQKQSVGRIMEAKEPTGEQIKELWEWCGFTQNRIQIPAAGIDRPDGTWNTPDGIDIGMLWLPSINLNHLFKYAVPKLKREYPNWKVPLIDWLDKMKGDYEQDTLLLFWAIWEVIHGC